MGSDAYKKSAYQKLQFGNAIQDEPLTADFYTSDKYQFIAKVHFGYMARTLNEWMFENFPLSETKLQTYFYRKTPEQKFNMYNKVFKNLFIDMSLATLGARDLSIENLETRYKKGHIAEQRSRYEMDDREYAYHSAREDALKVALELARDMGLDKVNFYALYKAHNPSEYHALCANTIYVQDDLIND